MLKSKKKVNGILLFDKDVGQSSNWALQKVKISLVPKRLGIPEPGRASVGITPICFGESTKVSQYLLGARKT